MLNIPRIVRIEKNKLNSPNPFIVLLDITLPDLTVISLARNPEDVVYNGTTYAAFNFIFDTTKEDSKGEVPRLNIRIGNATRFLQKYMDELKGFVGLEVKITIVNASLLDEDFSELEQTYDILESSSTEQEVTFVLGPPSPLRHRFPLFRYLPLSCRWVFRERECNYTGGDLTCRRTFEDCNSASKDNTPRFGGFPGLDAGGLKIV